MLTFFASAHIFWNSLTMHEVVLETWTQQVVTAEMTGQHGQQSHFKKPVRRHLTGNFGQLFCSCLLICLRLYVLPRNPV